jgi:SAM-dependent methyltransferase
MVLFKNHYDSHDHSLKVLNLLREYDSFLDSIRVVADMGCGGGLDAKWWAELATRDDPPEPHNYIVYAVDKNIKLLESGIADIPNIVPIEGNFEERIVPRQVDLIWAHDSLQYAANPMKTLATWKTSMNANGMLILSIPQTTFIKDNKLNIVSYHSQYYNYNVLNLTYMLAVNGFDCRDAYFYREQGTPWLYAAVYATELEPFTESVTWYELAERRLINDSLVNSVNKYGYARVEDLLVSWLDKDNYRITD